MSCVYIGKANHGLSMAYHFHCATTVCVCVRALLLIYSQTNFDGHKTFAHQTIETVLCR